MVKTERLEIDARYGEQWQGTYVFSEISWAKRSRLIQKHTKYDSTTGQVISSDFLAIQAETVMAALRGQPEKKPLTLERMLADDIEQGIPIELGEKFSQLVNRLNGLSAENVRFLLERLGEEDRTQLLLSLGYVKSSAGHRTS